MKVLLSLFSLIMFVQIPFNAIENMTQNNLEYSTVEENDEDTNNQYFEESEQSIVTQEGEESNEYIAYSSNERKNERAVTSEQNLVGETVIYPATSKSGYTHKIYIYMKKGETLEISSTPRFIYPNNNPYLQQETRPFKFSFEPAFGRSSALLQMFLIHL